MGTRGRQRGKAACLVLLAAMSVAGCGDTRTASEKLHYPDTDPSTWPASAFDEVMSAEEKEAWLAELGPDADCSPASLIVDYGDGRLSPEQFTAFAMYGLYRSPDELPRRYRPCRDQDTAQILAISAAMYIDDIDPTFRDELWMEIMGEPYWGEADLPADELAPPTNEG